MSSPVLVITPTVVGDHFEDCRRSVREQSYGHVHHLMVVDGQEHVARYNKRALAQGFTNMDHLLMLPWNVGKDDGNWYGHRVYAAVPKLIPTSRFKYVFFLDEDNEYAPDHVEECVKALEAEPDAWMSHSKRQIIDEDGDEVILDLCESIYPEPIYGDKKNGYLIDTSSYCFRVDYIRRFSYLWDAEWGGDREFLRNTLDHKRVATNLHTLRYRLAGNQNSVTKKFFEVGNRIMNLGENLT